MKIINNTNGSITLDGEGIFIISCNNAAIYFEGIPTTPIGLTNFNTHMVSKKRMDAIIELLNNLD